MSYVRYLQHKSAYDNHVVMIKSGAFYEAYEMDAYILHIIKEYSVYPKTYKDQGHPTVGFPLFSLDVIMHELDIRSISYVVFEGATIVEIKDYPNNRYQKHVDNQQYQHMIRKMHALYDKEQHPEIPFNEDAITIGSKVTLYHLEKHELLTIRIIPAIRKHVPLHTSPYRAVSRTKLVIDYKIEKGIISLESPLGQALFGNKAGEKVVAVNDKRKGTTYQIITVDNSQVD